MAEERKIIATSIEDHSLKINTVRNIDLSLEQNRQQEILINRDDLKPNRIPTCHCFFKLWNGIKEVNSQGSNPTNPRGNEQTSGLPESDEPVFGHDSSSSVSGSDNTTNPTEETD
ncbi:hypothetical protein QEV68_10695 [Trueperella pyogenes]|uniref:hypothetical protein n=1 Tax=Trueperella pyogenes TaxID=1661 RepID=UPI00324F281C